MEERGRQKKIEKIKNEIDGLKKKLAKRMGELGELDVMSYRKDPVIKKLMIKICTLNSEGVGQCENFDDKKDPVCKLLRAEPQLIKRLELSEERLCPFYSKKK